MKKQKWLYPCLCMAMLLCTSTASSIAAPQMKKGEIKEVTVYRGQALITRAVEIPAGQSELIVTGLPHAIVPASLYAQSENGVDVLSVRYREDAVREDTREEVKQLDAEIEGIHNQLIDIEEQRALVLGTQRRYENFWKLASDATNSDFNRGLLQFKPIEQLTQYLEGKLRSQSEKVWELNDRKAELDKELGFLQERREELTKGQSRTERKAILYVRQNDAGQGMIELSYLVNQASWYPQYNLRAHPDVANALVEYLAVVNQNSGENWDNVALRLSTAEPTMVASAPELTPLEVVLAQIGQSANLPGMIPGMMPNNTKTEQQVQRAFSDEEVLRRFTQSRKEVARKGKAATRDLNELALSNQLFEFNTDNRRLQQVQQQLAQVARIEGISVTYQLEGALSLPSRNDQQLVTIAAIEMEADFTLVATPLLTDYVYLQADLINNSNTVLLPGSASMFRNGEFVGRGELPLVTMGETFTSGFGIDSQIQVAREVVDKTSRIQGGNRIETYQYRLTLNNYKDAAVKLRLLDRLAYSKHNNIMVKLNHTAPNLSQDASYQKTLSKKGILRWDLELTPNTIGQNATEVTYSITMEYEKNRQIQPK